MGSVTPRVVALLRMIKYLELNLVDFPTLDTLLTEVSSKTGISEEQIKSKRRQQQVCDARHAFFYLAERYGFTLKEIGRFTGGRDHSTALFGRDKIKQYFADYEGEIYEMPSVNKEKRFGSAVMSYCGPIPDWRTAIDNITEEQLTQLLERLGNETPGTLLRVRFYDPTERLSEAVGYLNDYNPGDINIRLDQITSLGERSECSNFVDIDCYALSEFSRFR